ncbi:MAG: glucose-1-phosphate adenylyltransferase, partial [Thermodesulfobacteriota bacterium]|nr:glucose-1-phosphate adenylyltransferase [Thermodesulfobacteriota bacterium]
YPLTLDRAKPAVNFGGIYRLIDFTLSNCINSGVRKIVILTQYKSLSLEKHLRLGWNIFESELDEYIFPIPPQMRINGDWYKGTADSIYQNLYFADKVDPKYFLILSADHIYKMDYSKMLTFHKEKNADATVATIEVSRKTISHFGIMKVDKKDRIVDFNEKPRAFKPLHDTSRPLANMGVYIFNSDILKYFLKEDARREKSHHDFGKDIIPRMINRGRVFAYDFRDENTRKPSYWRDVGTIDAYFKANMDMLSPNSRFDIYDTDWPIRTHKAQYPPARMRLDHQYPKKRADACFNSIVSAGCIINGGILRNCVLSPNVRINSHSHIRDSILMEGVNVGKDCKIKRAIIDKGVNIPKGTEIGYNTEEDRENFYVTQSGITVIAKGTKIQYPQRKITKSHEAFQPCFLSVAGELSW